MEKIIKTQDEIVFLINDDNAKCERLQLTNSDEVESVEVMYFVYLINEDNPQGKAYYYNNLNKASYIYNKNTDRLNHPSTAACKFADLGITINDLSYIFKIYEGEA